MLHNDTSTLLANYVVSRVHRVHIQSVTPCNCETALNQREVVLHPAECRKDKANVSSQSRNGDNPSIGSAA